MALAVNHSSGRYTHHIATHHPHGHCHTHNTNQPELTTLEGLFAGFREEKHQPGALRFDSLM